MADMPGVVSRVLSSGGAICSSDSAGLFLQRSIPFQSFSVYSNCKSVSSEDFAANTMNNNNTNNKRKRRPAGTPDPDAEVVSLSPQTLMESDRYICEICNQGFQREQNLQMHRRRHKVPWKLLKRESATVRKRVFVCPEPTCLHHDPSHALGDLVGIKKHFRRKHSTTKQWICHKCSKGYAVQSDYKAHMKTCGTRGHTCDCGRVFSRVESFIEHQDNCSATREMTEGDQLSVLCQTNKIPTYSKETEDTPTILTGSNGLLSRNTESNLSVELQLMPSGNQSSDIRFSPPSNSLLLSSSADNDRSLTDLQLTIGLKTEPSMKDLRDQNQNQRGNQDQTLTTALNGIAYAEQMREMAKKQLLIAEMELRKAKKIREEAEAELQKAKIMKERYTREALGCLGCRKQLGFCEMFGLQKHPSSLAMSMSVFSSTNLEAEEAEGADENDCGSMHE